MPEYLRPRGRKKSSLIYAALIGLALLAILITQIPAVKTRLVWRVEVARTYLRGVLSPVQALPTAHVVAAQANGSPQQTPSPVVTFPPTPQVSPTPQPTPTALPDRVQLEPPPYEKQDMNNCGPATLSMYLNHYGWQGDQYAVSSVIKPIDQDRNVNIDELLYFTRNYAGWLRSEFRVGGSIDLLRKFIAAGFPVVIEEGFYLEENFWPNDDRWAGHYLLITGYDDGAGAFTVQDSFLGENRSVPYPVLDRSWQTFNRIYFLLFTPEQEEQARALLGADWDERVNRQNALDAARAETQEDPENPFAWFNLGSNLVYFDSYAEAAGAYDRARQIGLPQRMLRYQFGPFFAYFNLNRNEDLMALSEYALKITPNSEEALLWRGWALYRDGRKPDALVEFQKALEAHPGYLDAQYAIDFVNAN
jgi:tetratricopeptide (TPR) repeat protein